MADRAAQLDALATALRRLRELLDRDAGCLRTRGIDPFLAEADRLRTDGFTQADLSALSGSVMSVYGGMGSLTDYVPWEGDGVARWADELDRTRGDAYAAALSLRVVGGPA